MHDTAFDSGRGFFDLYVAGVQAFVLDVGSQDINGTLRGCAPPGSRYIGVDLIPGPGVDIVLKNPHILPFKNNHFDVVVTSSCFEHAQMFWLMFLEMVRVVRPQGYIYINAPSNGIYHSYPHDYWRFYPDSGLALVAWAKQQGTKITLIESFISPRKADIWNDCVMIFRKGPLRTRELPRRLLSDLVKNATNVRRYDESAISNMAVATQDMLLLQQANERLHRSRLEIARLTRALSRSRSENNARKLRVAAKRSKEDAWRASAKGTDR